MPPIDVKLRNEGHIKKHLRSRGHETQNPRNQNLNVVINNKKVRKVCPSTLQVRQSTRKTCSYRKSPYNQARSGIQLEKRNLLQKRNVK